VAPSRRALADRERHLQFESLSGAVNARIRVSVPHLHRRQRGRRVRGQSRARDRC
jgi:hypothetical protein